MDLSNDNVIHVKKGQVEYLQFRKLLEYKDIVTHAYTLGKNVNFRTAKANKDPLEKEIYKNNNPCIEHEWFRYKGCYYGWCLRPESNQ